MHTLTPIRILAVLLSLGIIALGRSHDLGSILGIFIGVVAMVIWEAALGYNRGLRARFGAGGNIFAMSVLTFVVFLVVAPRITFAPAYTLGIVLGFALRNLFSVPKYRVYR